jgi:hypothetical protein
MSPAASHFAQSTFQEGADIYISSEETSKIFSAYELIRLEKKILAQTKTASDV